MGLFNKISEAIDDARYGRKAMAEYERFLDEQLREKFVRSYINMESIVDEHIHRLEIFSFERSGYEATINGLKLLGFDTEYGCVGKNITLTGIGHEGSTRGVEIKISVDGLHVGTVSNYNDSPVFAAVFNDEIEGVYVQFERKHDMISSGKKSVKSVVRPKGYLYVKLKEKKRKPLEILKAKLSTDFENIELVDFPSGEQRISFVKKIEAFSYFELPHLFQIVATSESEYEFLVSLLSFDNERERDEIIKNLEEANRLSEKGGFNPVVIDNQVFIGSSIEIVNTSLTTEALLYRINEIIGVIKRCYTLSANANHSSWK